MICKMMQFKVREEDQSHYISMCIIQFQGWAQGQGEHPIGLHSAGQLHLCSQLVHP